MRVAVIDLGSSSFTLLVAVIDPSGMLHRELKERMSLRLGLHLARGEVPEPEVELAMAAAERLYRRAVQSGADRIVIVATEALRQVVNGSRLVNRIAEAAGGEVHLLSGIDEARLAFVGMRASVATGSAPMLALDLGGGSLELATGHRYGVSWAASIDVGVLRLIGEMVDHDPPTAPECRLVRRAVRRRLLLPARRIPEGCAVVATGGTIRGMGRLIRARRASRLPLNQLTVTVEELQEMTRALLASDLEGRLRMPGMEERLAEILPMAGLIVVEILDRLGARRVTISEWGLREGVALTAAGSTEDTAFSSRPVIA